MSAALPPPTAPVSEIIVRFMARLGIDRIFGIPGAHILPVYDALIDSGIDSVLTKHEQGAAFMAGGHARATGKIGACIATAGPGATNLVTGIANAYADHLPVLAITGEAPTYLFGKGGLQESSGEGGSIDQVSLFKGITRYNRIIERADYLENVLNQAAKALLAGQPGPVLLSLPFNVQKERATADIPDRIGIAPRLPSSDYANGPVHALAQRLSEARMPVIVAGFGCIAAGAEAEVAQLSSLLQIPVATSLKAKGVIDESSPLALGSLGVTSNGQAYRFIVDHADLILFLGASFNERTSYLWDAALLAEKEIIQVDHDPAQIEKVFKADLAIEGDIRGVLRGVLQHLENAPVETRMRPEPNRPIAQDYALFQSGFSLVESFFRHLQACFAERAQVFDDNIIFAQNFLNLGQGARYFPNAGISSLGHAIPAAIGARMAVAQPTFAILGDGGFQMCGMELMTAVNYRVPINVVMFNNGAMGLIRKNQQQQYGGRYIGCDFVNPDFSLLAQSFGIAHKRVENEADLNDLFARYDLVNGINLIEIMLDRDLLPNYSSRR
jgi:acetolactate synthase-1/2/3 large subunit